SFSPLTQAQIYQIYSLKRTDSNQTKIAEIVGVDKSTISRELRRNKGQKGYRHKQAQRMAKERRHKAQCRITFSQWAVDEGLVKMKWSPEEVSGWLKKYFQIEISHEWIYQYIWKDKKKGGKLYQQLRCQKKYRKRSQTVEKRGKIPNQTSIEKRPAIVGTRKRIGDWEGDTIIGKGKQGAIVTLVDRKSRLLRMGLVARRTKNAVKETIIDLLKDYPVHTITLDNGKEFAEHEEVAQTLAVDIYFAHPYSSWERGTNENTNKLIRQYFPKKTDFNNLTDADLRYVENQLNYRPRKCLAFEQPMVFLKSHCCT
ncbi:MAG: IS30 family transposase, partial [Chloroflexota bacterium]|nr:IS30 family transposase [Chloroflexota bacterium]